MQISKTGKIIGVAIVLVIVVTLIFFLRGEEEAPRNVFIDESGQVLEEEPLVESEDTLNNTFTCPGGNTFTTSYNFGSNALTIVVEEGMSYVLEQAVSASGARYVSSNGDVVFWEHQGEASVELNGQILYEGCVAQI